MLSVLFFPTFLFVSCEKFEENTIGQEIQPEEDIIGLRKMDTLSITTGTLDADSVLTDELSSCLAGSLYDPVTGRTDCGTYTHLRLASENVNFGTVSDLAIDSVVFSMAYTGGFYGDTNTQVQFNVQRIEESFFADSIYYSSRKLQVQSPLLNEVEGKAYSIRPNTALPVGKDTTAAQLRIRLKTSVGQEFLDHSGTPELANNTNFLAFFKGLYLSAAPVNTPGQGAIVNFNPVSLLSKLTIYYHHISTPDTLTFTMPVNSASARITSFDHDNSGTPLAQQLNGSVSGEQEVYVQSGGGSKVQLQIPSLLQVLDSGLVVINKAELILPIVQGSDAYPFKPHDRLLLQANKADGTREILADQLEGDTYFGGYYSTIDKSYHFTITRHIQAILSGNKENLGIQVISAGSGVTANRTILGGSKNTFGKPTLKLTYTKP